MNARQSNNITTIVVAVTACTGLGGITGSYIVHDGDMYQCWQPCSDHRFGWHLYAAILAGK